ncbi:MAG: caleosin family protein [Thermoanaerobaculia bacterium]
MASRKRTNPAKGPLKKPHGERRTHRVRGKHDAEEAGRARPRENAAARSAPDSRSRTPLQKHVDFFDTDRDGKITLLETYQGLRRLGLGALRSALFGGVINAALGSPTSGAPSLTVDTNHIEAGKHGSDTGVFDESGFFVKERFDRMLARYDGDGDGALDSEELARLFEGNRTDFVGHLGSMAEFRLLLTLAGEDRNGRKVLTRRRLEEFYDGSLFHQLADEVRARRADRQAGLYATVRRSLEELY